MRKVLKVSTALILSLVMVLGMAVVSLAASKENVVEIVKAVDDDGNDVAYTLGEVSGWPALTEEIAAKKIGGDVKADELTVLWQYDLKADSLPVTITFSLSGVSADQETYLFHLDGQNADDWNEVDSSKGATFTHKFGDGELSPIGLVVRNLKKGADTTASTTDTKVPTGDNNNIAFWGILMCVAACGAVGTIIYAKKRRTN